MEPETTGIAATSYKMTDLITATFQDGFQEEFPGDNVRVSIYGNVDDEDSKIATIIFYWDFPSFLHVLNDQTRLLNLICSSPETAHAAAKNCVDVRISATDFASKVNETIARTRDAEDMRLKAQREANVLSRQVFSFAPGSNLGIFKK